MLEKELANFDPGLMEKPRWLLLNKMDLIPEDEREALRQQIVEALQWEAPCYSISAATGFGTEPLVHDILRYLKQEEWDG
jgi:GTP-binding protein